MRSMTCGSFTRARVSVAVGLTVAAALAGCSGAPVEAPAIGEGVATTSEALSGNDAVARGALWVAAQVPYCQSPNGQSDPDPSCSPVCMRPTNAQWDPYRSDCSGFVSWAWNLPAPGRTTSEFAPAQNDITQAIDGNSLLPGDALNVPGDHMILFVAWNTPGQSATFYEEPGCSASPPYAHEFQSNVAVSGSSVTVDYDGKTYTAIRYGALTGTVAADGGASAGDAAAGPACFVTTLGVSGVCMLTSACAALQNHVSTPGYCPGPNDIECCTSTATSDDAGGASDGTDSGVSAMEADSGAGATLGEAGDPSSSSTMPEAVAVGNRGSKGCSVAHERDPRSRFGIWLAAVALVAARRRRLRSRR
jgi:MYXO-CTERM domain-containing protein